jgi:hypothetical protein
VSLAPVFLEPAALRRAKFVRIHPDEADLTVSSIKKFLKLFDGKDMTISIHPTIAFTEASYYQSKTKDHAIGDLKAESKEMACVFITATNFFDFGVQATWYDGKFDSAFVGGQRSGHRPAKMFTLITKLTEEINRCLSA